MSPARCESCRQEMIDGVGCTVPVYDDFADGVTRPRVPYNPSPGGDQVCHDCGCGHGQLHHPGCDMERCPRCGGQVITCGCDKAEGKMRVDYELKPEQRQQMIAAQLEHLRTERYAHLINITRWRAIPEELRDGSEEPAIEQAETAVAVIEAQIDGLDAIGPGPGAIARS